MLNFIAGLMAGLLLPALTCALCIYLLDRSDR